MLRRYRLALIAAFGLGLIAASEPTRQQANQDHNAAKPVEQALKDFSEFQNQSEPTDYNPPCNPGDDDRKSDLCAQWKAADGAAASALWTERTFYLGIAGLMVGLFTLGAAVAAAIFAKRAAVATENTVAIAREGASGAAEALKIAERNAQAAQDQVEIAARAAERSLSMSIAQVRAYLSVRPTAVQRESHGLRITAEYVNSGASPARNLQIGLTLLSGKRTSKEWKGRRPLGDVAAGQSGSLDYSISLNVVGGYNFAADGHAIVVLTAKYVDVFGNWQSDPFESSLSFFPEQEPSVEPFPEWRHKTAAQIGD